MRVLVLLLLLSAVALAEPPPPPEPEVPPNGSPWIGIHEEAEVGMAIASMSFGRVGSPGTGPHLGVGWRSGAWRLSATGDAIAIDERIGGEFLRGGLGVRRSFARRGKIYEDRVWGGLLGWIEGGVGYQRVRWDGGMRIDRADLALGVGAAYRAHIPGDHPSSIAAAWAVTATVANAPDPATLPPCGDTCMRTRGRDVSVLFTISLELGR